MFFRSRRIITSAPLILAFFLALIPLSQAGFGVISKTVASSISSTGLRPGGAPTPRSSAQNTLLSGTSRLHPIPTLPSSRADETGLCHHPGTSSVPLWECSHDGSAGSIVSSTLLAAEVLLPAEILFPAATLPLIPRDLPASRFFGLSPERPPKSFTSVL
ncbi:MAG: hypothetical protein VST70_04805 [Nitrospirota bacterium]|nr:hypothetical protein [Nitrospirota bacterium]